MSLINRWLHSLLPQLTWTSIAISRNARLEVHADRGNAEGSSNITVTLGQFSDGQLWLEHASGDVRMPCSDSANAMGIVVDTHMRPYVFCPRTRHATMPFTGERWCLTAYTAADNVSLTPALQAKLEELCFPVPASSKASHVQTPQAEPAMLLTSSSADLRQVLLGPEPRHDPTRTTPHPPHVELLRALLVLRCVGFASSRGLLQPPLVTTLAPHQRCSCLVISPSAFVQPDRSLGEVAETCRNSQVCNRLEAHGWCSTCGRA